MLALACFLTGCAALRGQPDGLTKENFQAFSGTDLAKNLEVAQSLADIWRKDRKYTYDWVFWSNASLVPLAAGGAGAALFKGSKDLITGIGLAAGTVFGTNTFIGAADLGAAYQSGLNGLNCIYVRLSPYTDANKKSAAAKLLTDSNDLNNEIGTAARSLAASQALPLGDPLEVAERTANPTIMSTLSSNEKTLTQAIASAQAAVSAAISEEHLFDTVATFARDRIMDVDNIISMRIKPKTVNFSILSNTLSTPAPIPPPPGAGVAPVVAASGGITILNAPLSDKTPIAKAADDALRDANSLMTRTQHLVTDTAVFDLSTQENNVATCLKNL
jgi:hypothetical protein